MTPKTLTVALPGRRDPAVAVAVFALWALLALFVVYPLAMLFARILTDHGTFTTAGIVAILTDKHQVRAFWNSLLLATLVGGAGTALGFLFAFTAARARLPRSLLWAVDAAVLLRASVRSRSRLRRARPSGSG